MHRALSNLLATPVSGRLLLGLLAGLLLGTLLWVAPVQAQTPDDDMARTHFQSGRLYFDRGEYEAALHDFEAAYELSHRTPLLYNLYVTLENLGRFSEAAERLERYLAEDTALDAETRANYESRLANLRVRAAEQEEATTATPPSPSSGGMGGLGVAGIATLAVGGASLVVFAITGPMALAEDSAVGARCGEGAGRTCGESDVSTLRALTITADVTMVAGLVLAAAGGTMLAIDLSSSHGTEAAVAAVPVIAPGYAGIQIGGRL